MSWEIPDGIKATLKSVVEDFGRDPAAISKGAGKPDRKMQEDQNLSGRRTELAKKWPRERGRLI